jgi:hypothetical protein
MRALYENCAKMLENLPHPSMHQFVQMIVGDNARKFVTKMVGD